MGEIKSAIEIAMEKVKKLSEGVQLDENHAY